MAFFCTTLKLQHEAGMTWGFPVVYASPRSMATVTSACYKCWGPSELPLSANLQWHLLVTKDVPARGQCESPCFQTHATCFIPLGFPSSRFASVFLYILVQESGLCLAWFICKPLIYHLSSVLSWNTSNCLGGGTGTSWLLLPRAKSFRYVRTFVDHSHTAIPVILQDSCCPYTAVLGTQHLATLWRPWKVTLYLWLSAMMPRWSLLNWWKEGSITSNHSPTADS